MSFDTLVLGVKIKRACLVCYKTELKGIIHNTTLTSYNPMKTGSQYDCLYTCKTVDEFTTQDCWGLRYDSDGSCYFYSGLCLPECLM